MPEIEEVDTTGGVPEEEVPEEEAVEPGSDADLERFFLKVKCTKEEALTAKHLQWGWKEMGKEDGAALAFVIRNNPVCITLDLFVNEIYEEAGALVGLALKDNVKLKSLDLQQAQIGVEGGRAIAEALRTNTTLMNLKLYYNCLGPVGTKAIAEALQANTKLTNLDLGDNGVARQGCEALAAMLGKNTTLARLDVSKNVGVQGDDEAKGLLSAAAAKRKAPLNLIMNDEPGQRWSVDGFVDVVEWTR